MLSTQETLCITLLPMVIGGLLGGLFRGRTWGAALALGVAYAASFACVEGVGHVLRPQTASQWLSIFAIVITIFAILDAILALPLVVRMIGLIILVGGASAFILKFKFANGAWSNTGGLGVLLAIGCVGAISAVAWLPTRVEAMTTSALGMAMVMGIGGLCVMILADQTVGAGMSGAASAMLPLIVVSFVMARRRNPSTGLRALSTTFGGILAIALATAVFVSGVPFLEAGLIAAAPAVFWSSRFVPVGRFRPWQHATIRLLLASIPVGVALVLSIRALSQNDASDLYSEASQTEIVGSV